MDYLKKRQSDPEYLNNVIQQRNIIIEQEQRKNAQYQAQIQSLKKTLENTQKQLQTQQSLSEKQILNLNLAINQQNGQLQAQKHQISELQFQINMLKLKIKDIQKQNKNNIEKMKHEFQTQKQNFNLKVSKLEKNLSSLQNHYHVEQDISDDKRKIIEDSNRDLRGFSNQKQERMIIIQNQQFANQIQFQARQISSMLQKNQKLQQEIKSLKIDLDLHKQIQNDLVKRSSLAQSLIKQLNKRLKQYEGNESLRDSQINSIGQSSHASSQQSSRVSASKISQIKQKSLSDEINSLKFQNANLKNHTLYLQNMQKVYSQKYQTLGQIMAQYLQNVMFFKNNRKEEGMQTTNQVSLDLSQLKSKDLKQWRTQEIQAVMSLLINQIKPFLSKNSLIDFPQIKNISISFIEETNKDPVSLPKISQSYQKKYQKETGKLGMGNRFKDIPIDISTKILRSNLREWGTKVGYGGHIPNIAKNRMKSKSIAVQSQKSFN